jgi:thiamine pyrophosphokinase
MVFFMNNTRAVIFANGRLPDLAVAKSLLRPEDVLFAADAGASYILGMGLLPHTVVGDLDSLPAKDLKKLIRADVRLVRQPQDKDLTDLELTINCALAAGHRSLLIMAALGGRLDMTLSNLGLLTRPDLLQLDISLDDGVEQVVLVKHDIHLTGKAGDIVSLLPWAGVVEGVTTSGLRWPLSNECLEPHQTRPVSNEMLADEAVIRIESGLLLCIHRRFSAHTPDMN